MSKPSIVEELEPLFNPRSVAVIGATNNWHKWGFATFLSTLDGFKGRVYPVNIRGGEIVGHKAFERVTDILDPVDLAVFVIPAPNIPQIMKDCVRKGVRAGVIISAGFAETGAEGKRLQDEVVRIASKGGLRFVGPNCMGFWSASSSLRAFMFPLPIKEGPLAFVTQGGNVGAAVVMSAYERGIGFHRYVSCGCAADIQIEDYIEYFGYDPEVRVILTYVEGLNDGRRFMEKVSEVTKKKPVITLKPGKTAAAAKAIASHSGALSGSKAVYDAAFREIGVVSVENTEELLDTAIGFLTQPLPRGRNVAIITPGGSYGVLCADACASEDLNVIKLPEETISFLDKIFPPRWSRGNPVDPAGDRNLVAYLMAPEKLLQLEEVDSLIFMGFDSFPTFASLFSSLGSGYYGSKSWESSLPLLKTMRKPEITSISGLNLHDTEQLYQILRPIATVLSVAMSTGYKKEEVMELTRLLTSLLVSGKLDIAILEKIFGWLTYITETDSSPGIGVLTEATEALLRALISYWIEHYDKPVLATSFKVGLSRLEGSYYVYSSGERAAKVLTKLVEYKEYLERVGKYG